MKHYTLITGASQGIGKHFAIECAKQQMNLILVALPEKKLADTANEIISTYEVDVHYYGIDLTLPNSIRTIFLWCQEKNLIVNILINNAGLGATGKFESLNFSFHERMVLLNSNALMGLTWYFLPEMKKLPEAYILNIGSIASYCDIPYKVVYSSTKRFVYTFSRTLREELSQSSISVSVVCPGPVKTDSSSKFQSKKAKKLERLLILQPGNLAKYSIKMMKAKKAVILPGFTIKCFLFLRIFVPYRYQLKLMAFLFRTHLDRLNLESTTTL